MKFDNCRIIYMGTPEISAKVLKALLEAHFPIVAVISNEDKPVGRKAILEPTPVKRVALEYGLPVYQPHRIREDFSFLKEIPCDLILTMAYGQIVPNEVLAHPSMGCLNLHGSLLPKYRGAAPIQRAIIDGLTETGVTLMEMVAKMDAGRMYGKETVAIDPNDNYTSLCQKIADAAAALALRGIPQYIEGDLEGIPQEEAEVTFAEKIKPEHEHLLLALPSFELINMIRGLSETPGAYLLLEGKKLKIYKAHIKENTVLAPVGEIVSETKGLFFQSQDAVISIDDLQMEGKKRMDAKSFVNGTRGLVGKHFE